jgi:polyhydroxyalkanoate synthesis regulator phasin
LVEDGHELYDKGALAKNSELEQATEDLTLLSEALASPPKLWLDGKQIPYNGDEVALQRLALLCQNLGQELLSILETLKPQKPRNGIESFRKAVKAIEKSGKIESLERRLSKLQDQVNTRILAILR